MFNDVFVVASAPDPHDPLSPHEYMDESGISWVTGEMSGQNHRVAGSTDGRIERLECFFAWRAPKA